jgi:hypothetical protein
MVDKEDKEDKEDMVDKEDKEGMVEDKGVDKEVWDI